MVQGRITLRLVSGLIFLASGFCARAAQPDHFPVKPDPVMTRGEFCDDQDPDFVDYRYDDHVAYCMRNVSRFTKNEIYDLYQVPAKCRAEYTVDHYIPLFMGGSNHEVNLWPEHRAVKATRQNLEMELYVELKHGRISQKEAVRIITQAKMNPPEVSPSDCHLQSLDLAAQAQNRQND